MQLACCNLYPILCKSRNFLCQKSKWLVHPFIWDHQISNLNVMYRCSYLSMTSFCNIFMAEHLWLLIGSVMNLIQSTLITLSSLYFAVYLNELPYFTLKSFPELVFQLSFLQVFWTTNSAQLELQVVLATYQKLKGCWYSMT